MKIDIKLTDILTLPNIILLSLAIVTGLILFLPHSIIETLHLVNIRQDYGPIVGVLFLLFSTLWLVNTINSLIKIVRKTRNKKLFFDKADERLLSLNDYQKIIIYHLYSQHNYTFNLPVSDGAIIMLESEFMIKKIEGQYLIEDLNSARIPYVLQPWVIQELNKNLDLLNHIVKVYKDEKARSLISY